MKSKQFARKLHVMTSRWCKIKHVSEELKGTSNAMSYDGNEWKVTSYYFTALQVSVFFLNKHKQA